MMHATLIVSVTRTQPASSRLSLWFRCLLTPRQRISPTLPTYPANQHLPSFAPPASPYFWAMHMQNS